MEIGFFGLEVEPGKTYTQEIETSVKITNAALGAKINSAKRTTLEVNVDGEKFALCSLTPSKIEQQSISIIFAKGETTTFSLTGENTIYLTGNYIESGDDEDLESDEEQALAQLYDSDEMEEEDDMSDVDFDDEALVAAVDEDDDEVEVEEIKKQIKKITAQAQNGKKAAVPEIQTGVTKGQKRKQETQLISEKQVNGKKQKEEVSSENQPPQEIKSKQQQQQQQQKNKKSEEQKKSKNSNEKQQTTASAAKPETKSNIKKLPNGLVINDIKVGEGAKAKNGKKVSVRYIGRLTNGKVFDKNTQGAPFSFQLGRGEVIKGWDLGIQGMGIGGTRKISIPAPLAYGKSGAAPEIPPNANLEFEVKLLGVK